MGVGEWWVLTKVTEGVTKVTSFLNEFKELSFFFTNEEKDLLSVLLGGTELSFFWGHHMLMSTRAYSPLKRKGAMDDPLAPWLLRLSCPQSRRVWWTTALLANEMLGLVGLKWICCTAASWGWSLSLSSVHQHCQPIAIDGPEVITALKIFPVGQLGTVPFFWWECDRNALPCQLTSEPETSPSHT